MTRGVHALDEDAPNVEGLTMPRRLGYGLTLLAANDGNWGISELGQLFAILGNLE